MNDPAGTSTARSVLRQPHPRLQGLVEAYHGYHYQVGEPGVHHGIPSTSLTLVLSFDQPIDVGWLGAPSSRARYWALASGMSTDPVGIYHGGTQHGVQLDLTPAGARALLGVPAAALRGEIVPLRDVLGAQGDRLYDALIAGDSWQSRFAVLDRALGALATARGDLQHEPTLVHAWRRLHATNGRLQVAALADEVGWSRRQLHTRFRAEFGIGPKDAARLVRFAAARALVVTQGLPLAEVAARCGYADQAHLTREWRDLVGVPPTTWLRVERPFLQDSARNEREA